MTASRSRHPPAITFLFVPGNRPDRFDKALATRADAVIFDLEDAVAPDDKAAARRNVGDWVDAHRELAARIVVRINDAMTPWFAADLDLLRQGGIEAVMLPKAEDVAAIDALAGALPASAHVLPIVESALGLAAVDVIARAPRVERLVFGTLDYAVDLDLSGDERGLIQPSAQIALASRCAGIAAPVAGVTPAIDDDAQLLADLAFARAFGFGAKLCIHPRQVDVVRRAMLPAPEEIAWARKVLAATATGQGAVQVDGRMVDRPVILKARAILDRAPE
jgi:citrate lyase subunit beta/citryl-CoA lyase